MEMIAHDMGSAIMLPTAQVYTELCHGPGIELVLLVYKCLGRGCIIILSSKTLAWMEDATTDTP